MMSYVKKRQMDQKFVYLWDGAKKYYTVAATKDDDIHVVWKRYYTFFKEKIHLSKKSSFAFVSLWCGNALQEKFVLQKLIQDGYNFTYIAVDASKSMIHLAKETLSDVSWIDKIFVCADFCDTNFVKNMNKLTKNIDHKIFFFFWRTFGNPNQTNIADSLFNMLGENDYLWFDVLWRDNTNASVKIKIFERYTAYVKNQKYLNLFFTPLAALWLSLSQGKFLLKTNDESSVWAIVYSFFFVFEKKAVITIEGETLHFLPWEKINLIQIRNYDIERLIHFLAARDLLFIASEIQTMPGGIKDAQLLLQKK